MSTAVLPAVDLERLFGLELPCGGNRTPKSRPCPYSAAAEWESTHVCGPRTPTAFKCNACYREWYDGNFSGLCRCDDCGATGMRKGRMYRRL